MFLFLRKTNANIILLQETHSCDSDNKFWKSQWGDQAYFCHATHNSAGVALLFNKFTGDILETHNSDSGRWCIMLCKLDNIFFIICNVYGHNGTTQARTMFTEVLSKIRELQSKNKEALLIIGGDYNDAPNDIIDRIPGRVSQSSHFKATQFMSQELSVIDAWRFYSPDCKEFTWSNTRGTLQSRIDLWLTSSSSLQYISEINHSYAPLSDHKLISVHFTGSKESNKKLRGYWKLNNNLLKNKTFQNSVKLIALDIFPKNDMNNIQKWEYFKFKIREMAILCSKNIKKDKDKKEMEIMDELKTFLNKENLSEEEHIRLLQLQNEIDNLYTEAAKGAFIRSRAKWLELVKGTQVIFSLLKNVIKKDLTFRR